MSLNVYVAGTWSDRDTVRSMAGLLVRATGCSITEPWWDKPPAGPEGVSRAAYLRQCGRDDLVGVTRADVLVFVYNDDTRGAWLEMGYALALGRPVIVAAPAGCARVEGSPFCHLVGVRVVAPTVEAIAAAIRAVASEAA